MRQLRLSAAVPLLGLAGALALAGCGATTAVRPGQTLQVALGEYRVNPQDVRAPAGALTIEVHNYGRLTHDLVISLDGTPQTSTPPIAPGQTAWLYTDLPAGRYMMASSILSDQALGAYGTLQVVS